MALTKPKVVASSDRGGRVYSQATCHPPLKCGASSAAAALLHVPLSTQEAMLDQCGVGRIRW
jgi:hypothetical protein